MPNAAPGGRLEPSNHEDWLDNDAKSVRIGDKTVVSQLRNPLIMSRKSIKRGDKVLGSPHPHPNHVKGVFSALHFFARNNRKVLLAVPLRRICNILKVNELRTFKTPGIGPVSL